MGLHLNQTQEGFERYLSKREGFVYEEIWHFRGSWFSGPNKRIFNSLVGEGLLGRVGAIGQLKRDGMEFPDRTAYNGSVNGAAIYRVVDKELNKRILEMIKNGQN